ncbi:MAG: hypothetical protein HY226_04325 [Candidatus Vogelbacteria bacterium]|nr:hypothetical protein [Candidatus Vogelbacteria bacterium]
MSEKLIQTNKEVIPSVNELLWQEILKDIKTFPEHLRPDINEKFGVGHTNILMNSPSKKAVERWWERKFGVHFENRGDLLLRKFIESKKDIEPKKFETADQSNNLDQLFERVRSEKPEYFLAESFAEVVVDDLRDELGKLSQDDRKIVLRFVNKQPLKQWESKRLFEILKLEWKGKYGFSYSEKENVATLLKEKYPERNLSLVELEGKFIAATVSQDKDALKKIKSFYLKTFPDQTEGIEALMGFTAYLYDQKNLGTGPDYDKSRKRQYEDLTEYQFLLIDFVYSISGDLKTVTRFWRLMEDQARVLGSLSEFEKLRSGVMGQIAVMKSLKSNNISFSLPHPREDALYAVDLWIGDDMPLQIKVDNTIPLPLVAKFSDSISAPIGVFMGGEVVLLGGDYARNDGNYYIIDKTDRYMTKVLKQERETGKRLFGRFVMIPHSYFNIITGEPTKEFVNFIASVMDKKYDQTEIEKVKSKQKYSAINLTPVFFQKIELPKDGKVATAHDFFVKEFFDNAPEFPHEIQHLIKIRYGSSQNLAFIERHGLNMALDQYCLKKYGVSFTKDKEALVGILRNKYYPAEKL